VFATVSEGMWFEACCVIAQVTCVYLFHELPAAVRRKAAAEMARVCKPGGMVVSAGVDCLQRRFSFVCSEPAVCTHSAVMSLCLTCSIASVAAGPHRQRAAGRS
jgi:hypothetical protein